MTHGTDEAAGDDPVCLWVEADFPEAQARNAEDALALALSFLR
jgi:hypothetical protein